MMESINVCTVTWRKKKSWSRWVYALRFQLQAPVPSAASKASTLAGNFVASVHNQTTAKASNWDWYWVKIGIFLDIYHFNINPFQFLLQFVFQFSFPLFSSSLRFTIFTFRNLYYSISRNQNVFKKTQTFFTINNEKITVEQIDFSRLFHGMFEKKIAFLIDASNIVSLTIVKIFSIFSKNLNMDSSNS